MRRIWAIRVLEGVSYFYTVLPTSIHSIVSSWLLEDMSMGIIMSVQAQEGPYSYTLKYCQETILISQPQEALVSTIMGQEREE